MGDVEAAVLSARIDLFCYSIVKKYGLPLLKAVPFDVEYISFDLPLGLCSAK